MYSCVELQMKGIDPQDKDLLCTHWEIERTDSLCAADNLGLVE
jgi:hypothetical protein